MTNKTPGDKTLLTHAGRPFNPAFPYVNPPVVRASTVLFESVHRMHECEAHRNAGIKDSPTYGIWGTPTHEAFYEALKALEGPEAVGAWAFSTGLAACTVPLMAFVSAGDHTLFADTVYGPTRDFAENVLTRFGVEVEFYEPRIGAGIEQLIRANTKLVMMETVGTHSFELQDVPAIAAVCRKHNVISVIDNTWATPLYFKPLDHGVDMVIHAATKYIAGASDLMMGVVICNKKAWKPVFQLVADTGQATPSDDVYLAYRGLHSMAARMKAAEDGAAQVIAWFKAQPEVEAILWPADPDNPDYALWKRDYKGASPLFGVRFKPEWAGKLEPMVDALKLIGRGYSWGGYESLLVMSYGKRTTGKVPFDRMIRMAVGLEDPADLIADLEQAFAALRNH